MIKIPFDEKNRASIIKEQTAKGLFLVEEQAHADGNFLVFDTKPQSNEPAPTIESLTAKLAALEAKVNALEAK